MEPSEKSTPDTEIDFRGIEERDEVVYKTALDGYFRKPELVRFLMEENLALKLVLFEKGLLTPEEHKEAQERAKAVVAEEVRRQIDEWRKNNPKEATLFDILAKRGKDARSTGTKSDDGT